MLTLPYFVGMMALSRTMWESPSMLSLKSALQGASPMKKMSSRRQPKCWLHEDQPKLLHGWSAQTLPEEEETAEHFMESCPHKPESGHNWTLLSWGGATELLQAGQPAAYSDYKSHQKAQDRWRRGLQQWSLPEDRTITALHLSLLSNREEQFDLQKVNKPMNNTANKEMKRTILGLMNRPAK